MTTAGFIGYLLLGLIWGYMCWLGMMAAQETPIWFAKIRAGHRSVVEHWASMH